jgi:hypothetical protein
MVNNGATNWIGFSQGTRVIANGFSMASSAAAAQVNFQGFGGQAFVTAAGYGLNSASNVTTMNDVVGSPISPINLLQPSNLLQDSTSNESREIISQFPDKFDHHFENYLPYIHAF